MGTCLRVVPKHVVISSSGNEYNGIGNKFYQGMYNTMYFGKLKTKMSEVVAHVEKLDSNDENGALLILFKAFCVWLDNPTARDATAHIPNLGARFNPKRLAMLINGDRVSLGG